MENAKSESEPALNILAKPNKRLRDESDSDSEVDKHSKSPKSENYQSSHLDQEIVRKSSLVAGSTSLTSFGDEINHILPKANIDFSELQHLNVSKADVHNILIRHGDQFTLETRRPSQESIRVTFFLPPYELALEYLESFNLFLGECFYFLNIGRFRQAMYTTYFQQIPETTISREQILFFTTLLMVLAIGKMYHAGQGKDSTIATYTNFPGAEYFDKATFLINFAYNDLQCGTCSIENVEALLLISFYHQTVDASIGHYILSGMTLRTALILGMHKHNQTNDIYSRYEEEHRRRLWWTVYGIDRYCSATSGHPLSITDEVITTELPSNIPDSMARDDAAKCDTHSDSIYMTQYVKLLRIFSSMISRLYQRKSHSDIIPVMLSILADVYQWQRDLPNILKVDYTKEPFQVSRVIVNIHSEYFRCVNLTIRPVLLYFVRKRLRSRRTKRTPIDLSKYSKDIIALLNASLQACIQTLRSHDYLLSISQLAKFGYLDREYIYSAISTIVLFNVAFGVNGSASQHINVGLALLSEMQKVGNKNAAQRKKQILHLISTFENNGIPTHLALVQASLKVKSGTERLLNNESLPKTERLPSISHSPGLFTDSPGILNRGFPSLQTTDYSSSPSGAAFRKDKRDPLSPGSSTHYERNESHQLPSISHLQYQAYDTPNQYGSVSLPPPSPQGMATILSNWPPSPSPLADIKMQDAMNPPASPVSKYDSTGNTKGGPHSAGSSPERYTQNFILLDQNGPDMFEHDVLSSLSSFGLTSGSLGLPTNLFGQESMPSNPDGSGANSSCVAYPSHPYSDQSDGMPFSSFGRSGTDIEVTGTRTGAGSLNATPNDSASLKRGSTTMPHMGPGLPLKVPAHYNHQALDSSSSSHTRGEGSNFSVEQEQNLWNEVTSQSLLWFGNVPEEFKNAPFGS